MNLNDFTAIGLLAALAIGFMCMLTGLAMIWEPLALLGMGAVIITAAGVAAYFKGATAR